MTMENVEQDLMNVIPEVVTWFACEESEQTSVPPPRSTELAYHLPLSDAIQRLSRQPRTDSVYFEVIDQVKELVSQVVGKRSDILRRRPHDRGNRVLKARDGRILLFNPFASLNDGIAEEKSQGFFDVCNTPAWDTWVTFVEERDRRRGGYWQGGLGWDEYLVCWIPPKLVATADLGVQSNAEGCLSWADDGNLAMLSVARFANDGFLGRL